MTDVQISLSDLYNVQQLDSGGIKQDEGNNTVLAVDGDRNIIFKDGSNIEQLIISKLGLKLKDGVAVNNITDIIDSLDINNNKSLSTVKGIVDYLETHTTGLLKHYDYDTREQFEAITFNADNTPTIAFIADYRTSEQITSGDTAYWSFVYVDFNGAVYKHELMNLLMSNDTTETQIASTTELKDYFYDVNMIFDGNTQILNDAHPLWAHFIYEGNSHLFSNYFSTKYKGCRMIGFDDSSRGISPPTSYGGLEIEINQTVDNALFFKMPMDRWSLFHMWILDPDTKTPVKYLGALHNSGYDPQADYSCATTQINPYNTINKDNFSHEWSYVIATKEDIAQYSKDGYLSVSFNSITSVNGHADQWISGVAVASVRRIIKATPAVFSYLDNFGVTGGITNFFANEYYGLSAGYIMANSVNQDFRLPIYRTGKKIRLIMIQFTTETDAKPEFRIRLADGTIKIGKYTDFTSSLFARMFINTSQSNAYRLLDIELTIQEVIDNTIDLNGLKLLQFDVYNQYYDSYVIHGFVTEEI